MTYEAWRSLVVVHLGRVPAIDIEDDMSFLHAIGMTPAVAAERMRGKFGWRG